MATAAHPPVSIIVPFAGDFQAAQRLLRDLEALQLGDDDELILVDNSRRPILPAVAGDHRANPVIAGVRRSSYHARNAGAHRARCDWLLFVDADCRPTVSLLDDYFAAPIAERCGAVGGAVEPVGEQDGVVARYARARRYLDQADFMARPRPFLATVNLLVRHAAWADIGGFREVRSGGDVDFCWRLLDAGWSLEHNPGAAVEHRHRDSLAGLLRQRGRYGAGARWLDRHHPGARAPARAGHGLARSLAASAIAATRREREAALFAALDAASYGAHLVGRTAGNEPGTGSPRERAAARLRQVLPGRGRKASVAVPKAPVVLLTDLFPAISETFVVEEARALRRLGHRVRVEAMTRPTDAPAETHLDELPVSYLADGSPATRLRDLARLMLRHPVRSAADLMSRRRWRREEPVLPLRAIAPLARRLPAEEHLHVHFAAGAALCALRIRRLTGHPYSVTAHGYDIFQRPGNLREKLEGATFATSGSDYTVRHLRQKVGNHHASRVHKIVMGVSGRRLRRRTPYPGDGTVCAVGRLIEKKGFRHLVEAAALLWPEGPLERLVILGNGPLEPELRELAERVGVGDAVEWLGARPHEQVVALLEGSDLLVMPCVVAGDGDRDSMPVVVKEALAMEVPVVASDEVGLPEVVRAPWGELVPPGDSRALAAAIARVLHLPAEERARMGRAGRAHVLTTCNVDTETSKLSALIESARVADPRARYSSGST